ncbi:MAG: hypothetical protein AB1797_13130 [bacterium]
MITEKDFERVWKIAEENQREIRALLEGTKELRESQKKTDEQIRKTDAEIDKRLDKLTLEVDRVSKGLDKLGVEVDRVSKEVDKVNKSVAGISDGWGRFMEGLVRPGVEEAFNALGMDISTFSATRIRRRINGQGMELDLIQPAKREGIDILLVVEVKTYLRTEDVHNFLDKLGRFYEFFEEYRDRRIIGVMAFMNYVEESKLYAERQGFYILAPSGETVTIQNSPGFEPKVWRYVGKN